MNTISNASDKQGSAISINEMSLTGACLSITIKNNQDNTIYLAKWDIMQSGELTKDVFTIESITGIQSAYKGRLVKRSEPTLDDLVPVKSGQQLTMKVDLAKFYDIQGEIIKVIYDATIPVYEVNNKFIQILDFETIKSTHIK